MKKYITGLQDIKVPNCFKDVEEFTHKVDAIRYADRLTDETGRVAIVFERDTAEGIVYRTKEIDHAVSVRRAVPNQRSKSRR